MAIVVAELGINHLGEIEIAENMIRAAKNCGVDFVKFQMRTPEQAVPESEWEKPKVWRGETITYLQYREATEFNLEQYKRLAETARSVGISWFASVWDIPSLRRLLEFNPPFIKIPSAKITDWHLLRECAKTGRPLIVSAGMTTEPELNRALEIINNYRDSQVYLLHTTSSYPCVDPEINLRLMLNMKLDYGWRRGNLHFGFSNHSPSPYPAIYAAVLGAEMLEVHLTLNRAWEGTDQAASIEPPGLSLIVREVKRIPILMGDGKRRLWESEIEPRKKLRGN